MGLDEIRKLPEKLKVMLLFCTLESGGADQEVMELVKKLLKNGCPVDAVLLTIDDIANEMGMQSVRDLLGDDFHIKFEGEE